MKIDTSMTRRCTVIFLALGLSVSLGSGGLLAAPQGNNAADPDISLIRFHESVDRALVEEHGGEVWITFRSTVYAYMTPEAA